jgi:hypothetical protein
MELPNADYKILFEAELTVDDGEESRGLLASSGIALPRVTIGYLPSYKASAADFDRNYQPQFDKYQYHVLNLVCNFDVLDRSTRIDTARLMVQMVGKPESPIACAAQPEVQIVKDGKLVKTLKLGPTIKAGEKAEASLGELSFEREQPIQDVFVRATGLGQSELSWRYTRVAKYSIEGIQHVRMISLAPLATLSALVFLDLNAEMSTRNPSLPILPLYLNKRSVPPDSRTIKLF